MWTNENRLQLILEYSLSVVRLKLMKAAEVFESFYCGGIKIGKAVN